MEEIKANSLNELRKVISDFRKVVASYDIPIVSGKPCIERGDILFRGQENASWKLETTLERASPDKFYVRGYVHRALRGIHQIESFSGHRWQIDRSKIDAEFADNHEFRINLPGYSYLVYLRHSSFPSPLLDWSESPYVATFFAYESARGKDDLALYCYAERPRGTKGGWSGEALIDVQGPFVTTHKRHFSQRAWYSVAGRWDENRKDHYFVTHEEVFQRNQPDQDVLLKIRMPSSIRKQVLEELGDYNINYFTLFHSEDALIKSIAMTTFDSSDDSHGRTGGR
ncbi:MAG: FRG domain-containing protein [Elusimicrobia bacterium]|nr:FRG domain-containing protein [Elusimicrobiota bacterium]